jgi:iron complex transport system substrate-binding protein
MKFIKAIPAILLALILVIGGCGQNGQAPAGGGRTIPGRDGGLVTVPAGIDRLISTAPSNTEIIIDLGFADKLIAVDKYSSGLEGIPGSPVLIDFMYPDAEVILGINPSLIIAAEHNQTASGEDPFKLIREAGVPVVYIPTSAGIEDIYRDIGFIAELLGAPGRGAVLTDRMKGELEAVAAAAASAVGEKKSVYLEISPFPFMVSCGQGTYLNEMIELIGAVNIFAGEQGWFSPSAEAIIAANPEVILTLVDTAEAAGSAPAVTAAEEIKARAGFETVRAVKNNEVYYIDADSASRPSPRLITALRQMARAVYPLVYAEKD